MKTYVAHDCKNPRCDVRWLDTDDNNATARPPQSKYCPDCVVFEGFKNGKDPAKVARGKALAQKAKEKRQKYSSLEGL